MATVLATDRDGPATAAGILEYRVSNGAFQLGVEMFAIPNPSVRSRFNIMGLILFASS